jgi:flagellar biosynthesis chaperone FliJ
LSGNCAGQEFAGQFFLEEKEFLSLAETINQKEKQIIDLREEVDNKEQEISRKKTRSASWSARLRI